MRSIPLGALKKEFEKLGWVLLTDTLDSDGNRWPYGIRRGQYKEVFDSYELVVAALKRHRMSLR